MTEHELNEAIAILRGGKQVPQNLNGVTYLLWEVPGGPDTAEVGINPPSYTSSIGAAIELFRELPEATLFVEEKRVTVQIMPPEANTMSDCIYTYAPIGHEALAISLAWYQFKTGETVEITD